MGKKHPKKTANEKEKIAFLSGFSEAEWTLNGHEKKNVNILLNIYNALIPYVKGGKYLELGCGSGILCRFFYLFSGKKIITYGVDIEPKLIRLARKNNPEFKSNFSVSDYFELKPESLTGFSTVAIFLTKQQNWGKFKKFIRPIIKNNKGNIIVFRYEWGGTNDSKISDFFSKAKMAEISHVGRHFFIIKK